MAKGKKDSRERQISLADALGADAGISTQCFTVYIPNKDKDGKEIGTQRKWVLEAIGLFAEINGGATAMPPVEGAWRNDEEETVWENPIIVYTFVRTTEFMRNLARIREFLHRLGRETNQGEIAFEFDGRFYRIRTFDSA
jgi:hypothetical protein